MITVPSSKTATPDREPLSSVSEGLFGNGMRSHAPSPAVLHTALVDGAPFVYHERSRSTATVHAPDGDVLGGSSCGLEISTEPFASNVVVTMGSGNDPHIDAAWAGARSTSTKRPLDRRLAHQCIGHRDRRDIRPTPTCDRSNSGTAVNRAEGVGFEPTEGCPSHAFQACRFGRSRTPPGLRSTRYPAGNLEALAMRSR